MILQKCFIPFLYCLLLSCSFGKNKIIENERTNKPSSSVKSYAVNSDSIPVFETYSTSVGPEEEVEMYELTWPSDNLLCDGYSESEGPMSCSIFRLTSTKKIICIREHGAFCQGDSDFSRLFLFDNEGNLIYSDALGMYAPNKRVFYKLGKEFATVETPGEGEEPYAPRIIPSHSTEITTVKEFESKIEAYQTRMKARLKALKEMKFKTSETDAKNEAGKLMQELEETIKVGAVYTAGYVYRKPVSGEYSILTGTDVRVRAEPNSTSNVIGKVSYYDGDIEITDVKGEETIEPFGKHPWYKIKYTETNTLQAKEGWVFGAFVMKQVFKSN